MQALSSFDDSHHQEFIQQGYLGLGKVLSADGLQALQQRIDDLEQDPALTAPICSN